MDDLYSLIGTCIIEKVICRDRGCWASKEGLLIPRVQGE